ncbi:glycosyltransferase [Bacillus sp. FJAT-53711]|uniref:Glycosyltransferase n=1 Tax=Bacillus yunxiaonensis TaxID=3127665 RepID=A0ABU8FVB0_9BACI
MKNKVYDKLVSIIVPVYNAEQYLRKCINSLLNQSYKNIEIILVNDGSTDNSGKICDEYALENEKVKVIHQKNSGPSITRNVGIDAANGVYIQFVDSDDYIEPNMTEEMVNNMNEQVELVICSYRSFFLLEGNNNIRNHTCPINGKYSYSEFMQCFGELFRNTFINQLWNKLYVTELIKNNNLRFKENLNMGEDLLFNLEYIKECNYISSTDKYLYNYLIISNSSLTVSFKENLFEIEQMLFNRIKEFLIESNYYDGKNKELVKIGYAESCINCLEHLFHMNSNLSSALKKEQISNIINDNFTRENISYFRNGNIQQRFIGLWVYLKSIEGIYLFFKIKTVLRSKVGLIFKLLKKINKIGN